MGKYIADEKRYEAMVYNRCGESGLKLPKVSLGMWHNFGKGQNFDNMEGMCHAAFDNGITHFDLANNYGFPHIGSAEENMGKILNSSLKCYRNELVISTKAGYRMWDGPYGDFGSRKYLLSSLDDSLKRLKLDYVDIFYHHRMDSDTPLEETIGALDQAVKSGKALYAGLSNYDAKTLKKATKIFKELNCPFIINQNKYSILDRTIENNGFLKACEEEKKGVIIFSPLAQGLLSDKYLEGIPQNSRIKTSGIYLKQSNITPELIKKLTELNKIAKLRGETLSQMALSWIFNQNAVTSVLIGASTPMQIKENAKIVNSAPFSDDEIKLINDISIH
ncbi:MAG: aldo/keto reductase [Clostridia bacterium]|nr:aldo/keto reductase [Clostridia bacterium]